MTLVEQGPKPQRTAQRLPASAPVVVAIYKVTDEAADVWNAYEGKDDIQLWQVQVQHDARPSITFGIVESFNDFLRQAHADNDAIPTTLMDLQGAGIKLVVTDRNDPDDVGFVPWRTAFYVAGKYEAKSLNNFLFLLDDFFVFKERALARERPFEVHVHPHVCVVIADVMEDLQYEHYVFNEPAPALPLGIFDAQPVVGKRIVHLHLQPETAEQMSVLVTGNTWSFRSRLDAHGVAGAYFAEDGGEENRKYYRVLKSIDVADTKQQERVLQMVGDRVFKNLALRVVLDSPPAQDTPVSAFVELLREKASLHFKA